MSPHQGRRSACHTEPGASADSGGRTGADPVSDTSAAQAPARVLVCSGLDPSGGAGMAADLAAIAAFGGHGLPLITAQTVQDGKEFSAVLTSDTKIFERQFAAVVHNFKPDAVKLGLLPSVKMIQTLDALLDLLPGTPVFCDPVLRAGYCQTPATEPGAHESLRRLLIPRCLMLTPNASEARQIGASQDTDTAARNIISMGCQNVLVTSAQAGAEILTHRLYRKSSGPEAVDFHSRPRDGNFHGSGCTLSAGMAACYAHEPDIVRSVRLALRYTANCIDRAWPAHPGIFFMRWQPMNNGEINNGDR